MATPEFQGIPWNIPWKSRVTWHWLKWQSQSSMEFHKSLCYGVSWCWWENCLLKSNVCTVIVLQTMNTLKVRTVSPDYSLHVIPYLLVDVLNGIVRRTWCVRVMHVINCSLSCVFNQAVYFFAAHAYRQFSAFTNWSVIHTNNVNCC